MANYCIHCGTVLHYEFGLCPRCNREQLNRLIGGRPAQAFGGYAAPQPAFANQAAVAQPIQVVTKTAEPIKQKRKHKSIFKVLLAMVMTVVLLGVGLGAMGIFAVRQATTEEALLTVVDDAELSDLIALLGSNAEPKFYGPIKDYVKKNTGISLTNDTIDRLLAASELKYYLAEKTADYVNDIYNGTENFSLEQKDVYRLLRANREEMEAVVKVSLSDDVLGQIADVLANQEITKQIGTAVLKENMPKTYYGLRFGLSYTAVAVLLAVAAMIFVAMLRLDFSLGILGCGVALTVTGGLFALPALLFKFTPTLLQTLVGNSFLQSAIMSFLNSNLLVSLLIFTVGIALLLVRASVLLLCKLFRI